MKKIILAGLLSVFPMISHSPEAIGKYIPLEEKLIEIENDKTKFADCAHKNWRYYMNLKESGYDVDLITGWIANTNVLHMYIRDSKGRVLDAIIKSNNDGELNQGSLIYRDIWVFKDDVTIYESLARDENKKFNKKVWKRFREERPNSVKRKITIKEKAKSIENYCKQDSSAWQHYKKQDKD